MFNGTIPLVAIQMRALQVDDKVGLVFTKVLDQMSLGLVDDDEGVSEVTDRSYWEDRATKKTVAMADKLLEIVREHDGSLELKYNKFYIGLAKDGNPFNFVTFRPKKNFVRVEPRLPESDEIKEKLDNSGLDLMEYDGKWGRYRVNINTGDLEKFREVLRDLISAAYDHAKGD
jgi:predicted transport protein